MGESIAGRLRQDWVIDSQKGNLEAFGRLVEAHQREVFGFLFRATNRTELADDLTQETFISAWKKLPELKGPLNFRAWLFKIALNKVRSHWRWKRIRHTVSLSSSLTEDGPSMESVITDTSRDANPMTIVEDRESEGMLQSMLESLSGRQREIVALRAQGLELHEIASILGVAVGTVKAHFFEARQKLRGAAGVGV